MENKINWNAELKNDFFEEAFRLYTKEEKNIYEIKKILIEKGMNDLEALELARRVEEVVEVDLRNKAKSDIVMGVVLSFGGFMITASSYNHAVGKGGGMYIVTYGLVISGITYIIKGVYLLSKIN